MNKIYQRIDWENYPSSATPLNEDNLNKMDYAIDKLDDRIVTHETTKLNTATGNTLVKNVTFDERTGVFTIEKLNGSKITINTALEKISTNFHFNPTTQKLILTLIDGTTQEIDLSALLTQYEFLESDTITFTIDASGKVKANILNGSITGEKLEPNYLANVTLQAKNAKTSADNAKTSEELAYQYAEEARESASQTAKSDAKNITYDNTESGLSATNVKDALDEVAQGSVSAIAIDTTITDSTDAPIIYLKENGFTKQDGTPTPDAPIEIKCLDKVSVKTCGKNELNREKAKSYTNYGLTFTLNDDGSVTVSGTATTNVYVPYGYFDGKAYQKYIVNGCPNGGGDTTYKLGIYLNDYRETYLLSDLGEGVSFTCPQDNTRYFISLVVYNGAQVNLTFYPMARKAEVIDSTYEPYTETTAAIPTDAPLYEGDYLEVYADGSGKLVRKMKKVILNGNSSEAWLKSIREVDGSIFYIRFDDAKFAISDDNTGKVQGLCSHFTMLESYNQMAKVMDYVYCGFGIVSASTVPRTMLGFFTNYANLTEWKSWLQSNPITVVYELAEPTETPLTAEQVAQFKQLYTFEPITNVLCDGETTIQYYKNTPGGVAVGTVHRMANDDKATYDGDGNVITSTYATKEDLENFDNSVELTKAEYDALPNDKLTNNIIYFIKDM